MVLTVLLKQHSQQTNRRIELEIINIANSNIANSSLTHDRYWATISQSKWWLPISKLWIVTERKVDPDIKKLFISNNGVKIQWDKLGIVEFLLKNNN